MKIPEGIKHPQGLILVEVTGEDILYYDKYPEMLERKLQDEKTRWAGWDGKLANKDITLLTANIFNVQNNTWSDNTIYRNKLGDYIRKGGRRYYLKDFV